MSSKIKSFNLKSNEYDDDDDEQDDYDNNVENFGTVNNNDTTSEYVQVNHAHTSPLSNSVYNSQYNNSNNYRAYYPQDSDCYVIGSTPPVKNELLSKLEFI